MNEMPNAASALFRSKVAAKMLALLLGESDRSYYLRELARRLNEPVSAIKREADRLERMGLLASFREGREKHYRANQEASVFPELSEFLLKTAGAERHLRERLAATPGVRLAFVYGPFAEDPESVVASIDLMVVGHVNKEALRTAIEQAAKALGRRITATQYEPEQFAQLFETGDASIHRAVGGKTRVLVASVPATAPER